MKFNSPLVQRFFRSFFNSPTSPTELAVETPLIPVASVSPILGYSVARDRLEPFFSAGGWMQSSNFAAGSRVSTNTTTSLEADGRAIVYGFIVNTAGTTSTVTFNDSGGSGIAVLPTTSIGIYAIPSGLVGVKEFVTAGGVAANITVLYQTYNGNALAPTLTGA